MKLNKKLTIGELASLLGVEHQGENKDEVISSIGDIKDGKKGEITFLSNPLYAKWLSNTNCSAVILQSKYADKCKADALISDNPRLVLAKLATLCEPKKDFELGVHSSAILGKNCNISDSAAITANCVIGDNVTIESNVVIQPGVVIGDNCIIKSNSTLKPNVTLYANVHIGSDTTIHSGSVIGSDGFGYANDADGNWVKMPHLGGVCVGNNVEIGSNTSIDRGFMEDTVIEDGVIIDNLVQIGHNVSIGSRTAIAGNVGIAGSTKVGKNCLIGGMSAIAGHIEITDKVIITAFSGVNRSIPKPGVYSSGMPAKENNVWRKNIARFFHLNDMAKRIRELEKKL